MTIKKPAPKARGVKRPPKPVQDKRIKAVQQATDVVVDLYGAAIKELANR